MTDGGGEHSRRHPRSGKARQRERSRIIRDTQPRGHDLPRAGRRASIAGVDAGVAGHCAPSGGSGAPLSISSPTAAGDATWISRRANTSAGGASARRKTHCPPGAPARPSARSHAPASPQFPPPSRRPPAPFRTTCPPAAGAHGSPRRPGFRHAGGASPPPRDWLVPHPDGLRLFTFPSAPAADARLFSPAFPLGWRFTNKIAVFVRGGSHARMMGSAG